MTQVNYDVFLCFRGADVRLGFLSYLVEALQSKSLKCFVDDEEMRGEVTSVFLQRIEESRVVLVIFSENFMDSEWCTEEVIKALATRGPGKTIIPIFYKVSVEQVENNWSVVQEGWNTITDAKNVTKYLGLVYTGKEARESDFVKDVVKEVEKTLTILKAREGSDGEAKVHKNNTSTTALRCFGIKQRVKQLQGKLKMDRADETRVVGVVGMKGIGKTKLAEMFFEEVKGEFDRHVFFKREMYRNDEKKSFLLMRLLQKTLLSTRKNVTTHEDVKEHLLEIKCLLVLDDFSCKEETAHLLGDLGWLTRGSKIVIVTSDKSQVEGLVDEIYVVPGLNEKEGLECFSYHAFGDATHCDTKGGHLLALSRKFVDYAKGNPKALMLLGKEVFKRDEGEWESILCAIEKNPNEDIQDLLKSSYEDLTDPQQDAFLDIACFFRSQDRTFVEMMVEPPHSADERSILQVLADKFLIEISGGQVEMNGLVYELGKNLASPDHMTGRLSNHQDIIKVLNKELAFPGDEVRGIFLDISQLAKRTPLRKQAFVGMNKLRYLKIYDSRIGSLESDSKLSIRNGLEFVLEEVQYLNWLKFPLDELPRSFNSQNLIDLQLPYSNIERIWNGHKDVRNLKRVDLSHSIKLHDLSGLTGAANIQRLNLEGCTALTILPAEMMQSMKSLGSLNLKSCTRLKSLPEISIRSLKTLILSNCSKFNKFQIILENLEYLYLDGTAMKELPESIRDLQKLVKLNMENCKKLERVPSSLGKLQALQEVIFSGCSKLQSVPDGMKRLRNLYLDGTSIKQVPQVLPSINGFSFLSLLSLSGNDVIQTLQNHIGQLYNLQSLDIKYCKNLISVPTLPPNLQTFDAHGCDSLTTVANPLAFPTPTLTHHIRSTFIFSECNNLDELAKSCILSYIHKKSQGSDTAASFPGCDVPEWFSHKAYGSKLEIQVAKHHNEDRIKGVALCAVVSFQDYRDQTSGFSVKCTSDFKNAPVILHCNIEDTARKIESDHVFVCYNSLLQMSKKEDKKESSSITVCLKFEVIDDADRVVKECKVFKCGLRLVYEAEVKSDGCPMGNHESMSPKTQEADVICIAYNNDEGQEEEE